MKSGREGMLTPRDDEIVRDLFFCRYLTTLQIASLHFNTPVRARKRLSQLKMKGALDNRVMYTIAPNPRNKYPGKREAVWHLSRDAFDMMLESLDLPDELRSKAVWSPKQLNGKNARDCVKVNQLYVAAKADLDFQAGTEMEWWWEHEKWATDSYTYSGYRKENKPDAHVYMFGKALFIIERQTEESHATMKEIERKVRSHATWEQAGRAPEEIKEVQVVFVCEEERIATAAKRAGQHYDIYTAAGSVERMAYHLMQSAPRIKMGKWTEKAS